jgi:hypothetical protein
MVSTRTTLERLSDWYLRHCDGEWEHGFGFEIRTLDNPGVAIDINLEDTELQRIPFDEFKDAYDSTDRWLLCRRTETLFEARGAATRFEDMLRIFLDWADAHQTI